MSNPKFNEDTLSEYPAIEQLKRLGYDYIHGDNFDPELSEDCERKSRKEVILVERLRKKLKDINPHLTPETIGKAIRKITHIHADSTLEASQIFHKYLISGTSIEQDIGARRQMQTVYYIDFNNIEKNEFLAVNQFWVKGHKFTDRPDIIIFINGIPIVVIECKSPVAKNTGVVKAQNQLIRYQKESPLLFRTNEILISCNLFGAKYGTIEATIQQYHEWKNKEEQPFPDMKDHPAVKEMLKLNLINKKDLSNHPPMQEVLIAGLLKKENLFNIIQNFIVFDYSKEKHRVIKKICRYQQFTAVNKIFHRVVNQKEKRGIIWHWQGSGKSLIMVFTSVKMRREEKNLKNPTILIVTDRVKLDNQISETFKNCNFSNPVRAKSMNDLYKHLKGSTGYTIMTTVQKFRKPLEKPLSEKENIIIMTDEAHRTQYGSYALNLRKALPNASFFAFTGTPLNKKDRNTYRHFSPPGERYLDRYDMKQSQEDKATVQIKYESRMANLQVIGNSIDRLLKELFPEKSGKELAEIRRRYATANKILSAPRRIERIAMDIVNHYNNKIAPNGFKAQIVATDRKTAIKYKEALDKLIDPSWSTVIISINNNDPEEWKSKYKRTSKEEDEITGKEIFQNPNNPLKFLIVCDKLITGFDAPVLQVMYLDQRMVEHSLLQTIARTNRPYPRKGYGLIVDYAGIGRELSKALSIFDEKDLEGMFTVEDFKTELAFLKDYHNKAMSLFKKVNLKEKPENIIQHCMEILSPEDIRLKFELLFRKLARSMDILMPDPCVDPFIKNFKFLGMIREGAYNLYRDDRMDMENCSKKVEDLIHAHIIDIGIEEILTPVNITSPDFEDKLEVKGSNKAKASHVEYAIRDTINKKIAEDPQFYTTLQEQLENIIVEDQQRRKDDAELLTDLVQLSKKEEERKEYAKKKGLNFDDEIAFYGLFKYYKEDIFKNEDQQIQTTKKIVQIIKNKKVIDWINKEDIQKAMRRDIKILLRKLNFPSEKLDFFTRELLELAKVKFGENNGED